MLLPPRHYGGPTTATSLLRSRLDTFFLAKSAHDGDQNGTPKFLTELGPRKAPKKSYVFYRKFVGVLQEHLSEGYDGVGLPAHLASL